jgi:hypothetical protein
MWRERGAIIWAMTRREKREEWLEDIEARQRNVVLPDTVNNEAWFWRNIICKFSFVLPRANHGG